MCNYFLPGIYQTGDITFLIRNLVIWIIICFQIGMKCHINVCIIHLRFTVEHCEGFLRTAQVTTQVNPISKISVYNAYVITSLWRHFPRKICKNLVSCFIYNVIQMSTRWINVDIVNWSFTYRLYLQRGRANPLKSITQFDCKYDMCFPIHFISEWPNILKNP